MIYGKHLIAGEWVGGAGTFASHPVSGAVKDYAVGTADLVDQACRVAEAAFCTYRETTREARAVFLEAIADQIDLRGTDITEIGSDETGLPRGRLEGERGRTNDQLRMFADHIRTGDYLDRRHDAALPSRTPLPRADLRMMRRPPSARLLCLARRTFRSRSQLRAATPPLPLQPAARLWSRGIVPIQAPQNWSPKPCLRRLKNAACRNLNLVQGGDRRVGQALVEHTAIRAVGFTGSLGGGRALRPFRRGAKAELPFLVNWDLSTQCSCYRRLWPHGRQISVGVGQPL